MLEILLYLILIAWVLLAMQTAANMSLFPSLERSDSGATAAVTPPVSIVIPARNEEPTIGATLDHALQQDYPDFEVIIVNDDSSDGTAEIIDQRRGRKGLISLATGPPPEGWLGKPHALATGTAVARGEWLLLMDADVALEPGALRAAVSTAESKGWDHLALLPHMEREGFWEQLLMPLLGTVFFVYAPSFLSLFEKTKLAFGGGAFNLVRRKAYDAAGGHQAIRNSVVDDVRLAMEIKRAGFKSRWRLGTNWLRLRMYRGLFDIVNGFTKNAHAMFRGHRWLAPVFILLGVCIDVLPFGALPARYAGWASGSPLIAWEASLALLLLCRGAAHARLGYPLWPVLLTPLTVVVGQYTLLRSLRMAYGEGVVRWRGRVYPLESTDF